MDPENPLFDDFEEFENDDDYAETEGIISVPIIEDGNLVDEIEIPLNGGHTEVGFESMDFISGTSGTLHLIRPDAQKLCKHCNKSMLDTIEVHSTLQKHIQEEDAVAQVMQGNPEMSENFDDSMFVGMIATLDVLASVYSILEPQPLNNNTLGNGLYIVVFDFDNQVVYLSFNVDYLDIQVISSITMNITRYVSKYDWTIKLGGPFKLQE